MSPGPSETGCHQRGLHAATPKGRQLLAVVPESLQSPDLMGRWEARLEAIAADAETPEAFLADIRVYTRELVAAAQSQERMTPAVDPGLGPCPKCHAGTVTAGRQGWGCSRWREGCDFVIWQTVAHKRLTEAQARALVAGKATGLLRGFRSKQGQPFAARLRLDGEARVVFQFAPAAASRPSRGKGRAAGAGRRRTGTGRRPS